MNKEEIELENGLKYEDLVSYLIKKYGPITKPFFVNENCSTKTSGLTRSKDGLFIHHVMEDRAIMLSNPQFAITQPYEYQLGKNLVYCNLLEHLILHMKITDDFIDVATDSVPKNKMSKERIKALEQTKDSHEFPGIGGVGNLIGPQINDYFFGGLKPTNWMSFAYDAISNNKDDYILLMKNFWEYELAKCRASGDEALLEFVKRSYASSKRASEYFPKLIVVKYW